VLVVLEGSHEVLELSVIEASVVAGEFLGIAAERVGLGIWRCEAVEGRTRGTAVSEEGIFLALG
jgi:hypothetical protein